MNGKEGNELEDVAMDELEDCSDYHERRRIVKAYAVRQGRVRVI